MSLTGRDVCFSVHFTLSTPKQRGLETWVKKVLPYIPLGKGKKIPANYPLPLMLRDIVSPVCGNLCTSNCQLIKKQMDQGPGPGAIQGPGWRDQPGPGTKVQGPARATDQGLAWARENFHGHLAEHWQEGHESPTGPGAFIYYLLLEESIPDLRVNLYD